MLVKPKCVWEVAYFLKICKQTAEKCKQIFQNWKKIWQFSKTFWLYQHDEVKYEPFQSYNQSKSLKHPMKYLYVIFYFLYSKSPLILIVTAKNSSAYSKEERRKRIDRRWTLFCARFLLLHKSRKEWSSDRERLEWHKRLISNPFGLKNSFAADAASKKAWFAIVMLSVTAARWCHIV